MNVTAFDLAQRFVGLAEVPGVVANPAIVAMLRLEDPGANSDEIPWCSAFANYIAWLLRLPRSKSLAARSWLSIGVPVILANAHPGFDVVVLSRGNSTWQGHVGFFAGTDEARGRILVLGGNQGDRVSVSDFGTSSLLGIRRLA